MCVTGLRSGLAAGWRRDGVGQLGGACLRIDLFGSEGGSEMGKLNRGNPLWAPLWAFGCQETIQRTRPWGWWQMEDGQKPWTPPAQTLPWHRQVCRLADSPFCPRCLPSRDVNLKRSNYWENGLWACRRGLF